MLGVAVVVGVLLWLWLTKTRMGMVIRAGVDDEPMVRALGINITLVFAVTFFVGAFLAGVGGVMGASFAGAATGSDGAWLLNSLVVVIIGGLGSIKGAVAGSVLYGMVRRAVTGVPARRVHVLLRHLHLRAAGRGAGGAPLRPVRAAGMSRRSVLSPSNVALAVIVVVLLVVPGTASDFFVTFVLTQTLILGLLAASLVFLASLGGMISLAQLLVAGSPGSCSPTCRSRRAPAGSTSAGTRGSRWPSPCSSPPPWPSCSARWPAGRPASTS